MKFKQLISIAAALIVGVVGIWFLGGKDLAMRLLLVERAVLESDESRLSDAIAKLNLPIASELLGETTALGYRSSIYRFKFALTEEEFGKIVEARSFDEITINDVNFPGWHKKFSMLDEISHQSDAMADLDFSTLQFLHGRDLGRNRLYLIYSRSSGLCWMEAQFDE